MLKAHHKFSLADSPMLLHGKMGMLRFGIAEILS